MTAKWRQLIAADPGCVLRLDTGPATKLGGRLFRKEVARVGAWTHPATGQEIAFSRSDLEEIAAGTNKYIAAIGGKLRGPRLHDGVWITGEQPKADDNLAYWLSFNVEGDRLYGVVEAGDEAVASMLGGRIRSVSLCLVPEAKDAHGGTYKNVLDHVAFTPEPVIEGQGEFVALSKGDRRIPIYQLSQTKEPIHMSALKTMLAAAYSLAADLPDEEFAAELDKKMKAAEAKKAAADDDLGGDSAGGGSGKAGRQGGSSGTSGTVAKAAAAAMSAKATEEITALSATIATLKAKESARDKADCDAAVTEMKALAAKNGRPEAFDADAEKEVRDLWSDRRGSAQRILSLARTAATVGVTAATKTAAPAGADAQRRQDMFDTRIALAREAGKRVEIAGDGKKATIHPLAADRAKGAKTEEVVA